MCSLYGFLDEDLQDIMLYKGMYYKIVLMEDLKQMVLRNFGDSTHDISGYKVRIMTKPTSKVSTLVHIARTTGIDTLTGPAQLGRLRLQSGAC
jgi:hypothetical protein